MEIQKVHKEAVWQLRHEVMWPDRELDYVKLEDDDHGMHYGLFGEEQLISVISLFIGGNEAQFRKFATRKEQQGQGYGSRLLQHVLDEAERIGVNRIFCNARSNKVAFYKKFGLIEVDGTAFSKGGKEYIIMEKLFGLAGDVSRKEP
ncbi:N-acetylglutamate synthase [compost metagenome]